MQKNKYIGPSFDETLKEEGTLEATEHAVFKKIRAEQGNIDDLENNLNIFLLDIAVPILEYLDAQNTDFELKFRTSCSTNRLFASSQSMYRSDTSDKKKTQIFQLTEEFLNTLLQLSENVGCECHDTPIEEYKKKLTQALKAYLEKLINVGDLRRFEYQLHNAMPLFIADYRLIQKTLDERGDLQSAENSLLCWKDAIPEIFLQDALVALRYTRMASIIKLNN